MRLSRMEKLVLAGVSAAGISVATSAALAEHLEIEPPPQQTLRDIGELQIQIPENITLPKSKEEVARQWAEGYVSVRSLKVLEKAFSIIGQTLVAPIAVVALDALYGVYTDYIDAKPVAM